MRLAFWGATSSAQSLQLHTSAPTSASVLAVFMPGQQEHSEWLLPGGPGHDVVAGECALTPPTPSGGQPASASLWPPHPGWVPRLGMEGQGAGGGGQGIRVGLQPVPFPLSPPDWSLPLCQQRGLGPLRRTGGLGRGGRPGGGRLRVACEPTEGRGGPWGCSTLPGPGWSVLSQALRGQRGGSQAQGTASVPPVASLGKPVLGAPKGTWGEPSGAAGPSAYRAAGRGQGCPRFSRQVRPPDPWFPLRLRVCCPYSGSVPSGHVRAAGPGLGVCAHLHLLGGESAPRPPHGLGLGWRAVVLGGPRLPSLAAE